MEFGLARRPAAGRPDGRDEATAPPLAQGRRFLGRTRSAARGSVGVVLLLAAWWAATAVLDPPRYVFPAPRDVLFAFARQWHVLLHHAGVTAIEIAIGLAAGVAAGIATALLIAAAPVTRRLVLPAVVVTQTLPVFAIAPLLVVWLGYGLASKITMAGLIIYFPIATAYAEAMARVDAGLVDLARLHGASRGAVLWLIRAPGGLPGLVAGLKVAATVAPIGAVVGEWVGASAGLGYVMLHANARLQTDMLFAALILLAALALLVRAVVDRLAESLIRWQPAT